MHLIRLYRGRGALQLPPRATLELAPSLRSRVVVAVPKSRSILCAEAKPARMQAAWKNVGMSPEQFEHRTATKNSAKLRANLPIEDPKVRHRLKRKTARCTRVLVPCLLHVRPSSIAAVMPGAGTMCMTA